MKQRLVVMNGSRIIETERQGRWSSEKVLPAGTLKSGVFDLYCATQAEKLKEYAGLIVHADKTGIFQQVGNRLVRHECLLFDKVPDIGSTTNIQYDGWGRAAVCAGALNHSRSRSR